MNCTVHMMSPPHVKCAGGLSKSIAVKLINKLIDHIAKNTNGLCIFRMDQDHDQTMRTLEFQIVNYFYATTKNALTSNGSKYYSKCVLKSITRS